MCVSFEGLFLLCYAWNELLASTPSSYIDSLTTLGVAAFGDRPWEGLMKVK